MKPVIWLLGLSGSGKTTLGSLLRLYLEGQDVEAEFIDSDVFYQRDGLSVCTPAEQVYAMNVLRDHVLDVSTRGKVCVVADITPYESMRQKNRGAFPLYREVWVRCALASLVERDVKNLYSRAACGELAFLRGVSDGFDEPRNADCILDTDSCTLADSYQQLRDFALDVLEETRQWDAMRRLLPEVPYFQFLPEHIGLRDA